MIYHTEILHESTAALVKQPEAVVLHRTLSALVEDPLCPPDQQKHLRAEADEIFEVMTPGEKGLVLGAERAILEPPIGSARLQSVGSTPQPVLRLAS